MKTLFDKKAAYLALAGLLLSAPVMAAQLTGEKDIHSIPESNPHSTAGIVEAKNDLMALAAGHSDRFKETRWDRLIQFFMPDVNVIVPGDYPTYEYPNYGFPIRLKSEDGEITASYYRVSWTLDVKTGAIRYTQYLTSTHQAGSPKWEEMLQRMKDLGQKALTLAETPAQERKVRRYLNNLKLAEKIIRKRI